MISNTIFYLTMCCFRFITTLGGLVWKLYLNPRFVLNHKLYLQISAITINWIFIYYTGLLSWFIYFCLGANYLFLNFALSHTYLPVTEEQVHWVEYAFKHTADVEQTPWCDWWMGYLNYQIEHHLFPTMPQFRLPLITYRVKALAKKHNLPYECSYREAVRKAFNNLVNVAEELKNS